MSKRNKFFVGLFVAALIAASVISGDPKFVMLIPIILGIAWVLWRAFVFLWTLVAPVRAEFKPVDDHIKATLDKTGLGAIGKFAERVERGVDRAVAETQKGIDARRNT